MGEEMNSVHDRPLMANRYCNDAQRRIIPRRLKKKKKTPICRKNLKETQEIPGELGLQSGRAGIFYRKIVRVVSPGCRKSEDQRNPE
jgi:hypothetical protein